MYYNFGNVTSVKRKKQDKSVVEVNSSTYTKGYNQFTGGVDLYNQKCKILSCSRKSTEIFAS